MKALVQENTTIGQIAVKVFATRGSGHGGQMRKGIGLALCLLAGFHSNSIDAGDTAKIHQGAKHQRCSHAVHRLDGFLGARVGGDDILGPIPGAVVPFGKGDFVDEVAGLVVGQMLLDALDADDIVNSLLQLEPEQRCRVYSYGLADMS